jgi:hypothetical protein
MGARLFASAAERKTRCRRQCSYRGRMFRLSWAQAAREGRIELDGPSSLGTAFPTWNARSMFAHIKPVRTDP